MTKADIIDALEKHRQGLPLTLKQVMAIRIYVIDAGFRMADENKDIYVLRGLDSLRKFWKQLEDEKIHEVALQ
ncbi:MAG: hypothetical protein FWB90_00595 [Fibromonadales bacterium]|nr:hypothetical protein [Fibromonadales bacterium]